jgi:hypothetical protein
MSVPLTDTRIVYTITEPDAGAEYSIDYPYIAPEDIKAVYSPTPGGALTHLVYGADYTVDGQTVTSLTPWPLGAALALFRETEATQDITLGGWAGLHTPSIMKADDKLTMLVQEMLERMDRAVTIPVTSDESAEELLDSIFDARDDSKESLIRNRGCSR